MKGLLSKKLLAFTLAAAIAIPATPVLAKDAVVTAAIDLTVSKFADEGTKVLTQTRSGLSVVVQDSSGKVLTKDTDYNVSESGGKYSITNLTKKDTYSITVNEDETQYATVKVPITSFSAKAKTAKLTWADSNEFSAKKIGAVGGIVTDGSGGVSDDAKLIVKNSSVTYTTYSNELGAFKAYVPSGKYDFIVTGADSNYQNVLYSLTVTAGQTAAPLDTLSTKTANNPAFPGIVLPETIAGETTTITGTVYGAGYAISVFSVTDGTYTLLGSGVSKAAKSGNPTFSVKMSSSHPDSTIVVRAEDKAGNVGEQSATISKVTLTDYKVPTNANVGTDFNITFKDPAKKFHTGVTEVTYKVGSDVFTLAVTDYTYGSGKLTIKAGSLPVGSYVIGAKSTGYNDLVSPSVSVAKSTKSAGAINATPAAGTVANSTKITITTPKADAANVWQIVYGSTTPTLLKLYDAKPETVNVADYTSGADVEGVDATTNKYIALYEVNAEGQVIKAKSITLSKTTVKAGE
ncbi:MAG: hypothetical protein J7639_18650 [Paenibacillaceae bacterium]|nr:hypothetical protein [Paenibacillaceae bacterium]